MLAPLNPRLLRVALVCVATLSLNVACEGQVKSNKKAATRNIYAVPTELRKVEVKPRPLSYELGSFPALPAVLTKYKTPPPSREQMDLGRQLFHDARFSKNHDISCNTCHVLAHYGVDHKAVSIGHRGQAGTRNAPTVFNAAGQASQFWDGRAKDVEEQATMPVLSANEMAMPNADAVLATIRSMPEYVAAFQLAFSASPEPVTYANFGAAIGAFERGLVTPARWDKFRQGDLLALTPDEVLGFTTFYQVGCSECHSGPLVGGNILERLGRSRPWPNQTDTGREQVTKDPMQRMSFRVSSLRNVAETGPYFHDASSTALDDAVRRMGEHQLNVALSSEQVGSIVAWLKTLTGEIDQAYISAPKLPASTASTPKPDPS